MKKLAHFLVGILCVVSTFAYAEHWPTGYYRATDSDSVYYYDDEFRWFCHMQGATHLDQYGATDQVRVVGDLWSIISLGVDLNQCPWRDGFYRAEDSETIFRLYPGNICYISSPEMLEAYGATDSVVVTEPGVDFGAHRTHIGQCFWPEW